MSQTPTRRRVTAWRAVSALVLSSLAAVAGAMSASAADDTLISTDFSDSSWESTWQASGSPELSLVEVDGNQALKVTGRTADYVGIQTIAGSLSDLVPGQTYTLSMKASERDSVACLTCSLTSRESK